MGPPARPGGPRLWVEDEGTGIPAEQREEAWLPFTRLQRPGGTARTGAGLGLAVVRELVEMHHGTVSIEDAPGGGARFVIELSGTRADEAAPAQPDDGGSERASSSCGGARPVTDAKGSEDAEGLEDALG